MCKQLFQVITKKKLPCFFRFRKKPIDINQEIIEMSSQIGSIYEFCSFVTTCYNLTNCTYPQCTVRNFNDKLKQVVVETNKS